MALARYEGVAVNLAGDVIPNATVDVRRDQPGRPVVPLFSDREGTVAIGNPITTDSEGKFAFHVSGGVYYIRVYTGPSQQPLQEYVRRYQAIGTAAERDVEDLASALEAGTAPFPTLAELQAFTPAADEGIGGKVTKGVDAGFYHYNPALAEGSRWVFDRPLYDTLAVVDVDGTVPNAQTGVVDALINPAGVVEFIAYPDVANTGPMTLSHDEETPKPVLNYAGNAMSAGEWATFVRYRDDGLGNYRLTIDANAAAVASAAATTASTKADEADASATEAAGYAAGLNIPAIVSGDAGKHLSVKGDESGSEWVDPALGDVVGPASATDGRLAGFDGTSGKLLEELSPINARLASDMFVDYLIQGLKPDKLSTNVLRLYPGVAGSADGLLMVRTTVNYDIDMSTNGVGGLDTGSPLGGLDYFVYVLRNNTTGAFAAVISNSITYGGVTLPAGHTHVRKLRFGFIYNVSWDGIPNHDAANWPWPLIRLTGSEASSVWRALNAGTSTTNAEVLCDDWIPDNCRIAMIMVRVACGASAGTGYITSSGAGHSNGIEFTGVPNSTYTAYVPAIRVDSLRKLLYKVTGDVALSIFVLGYYATEPS